MGLPETARVCIMSDFSWGRIGGGVNPTIGCCIITLEDRGNRIAVFEVVLDGGAGETRLPHNPTHARVIQNRQNQLLQLDFNGDKRLLLLLLYAASPLVRLSPFQSGDEGIGQRGLRVEEGAGGGGEAVEGDVEAKLKGSALERVRRLMRLRFEASPSEEAGSGTQQGGGDMQRSDLSVAAAPGQAERVLQHGSGLRRERLLRCASSCTHNLAHTPPPTPPLSLRDLTLLSSRTKTCNWETLALSSMYPPPLNQPTVRLAKLYSCVCVCV